MILNFLAVEGKITNDHIDIIWASAQVRTVFFRLNVFSVMEMCSVDQAVQSEV